MSENDEVKASESTNESSVDEVQGPLVFSCAKCRTIVGDSFSFYSSNESMRTITLAASSNIKRSPDVYTSKTGNDVGSTYFQFTCQNCSVTLGRYYLTTSKDLDEIREKFSFSVDTISSYELGKSQHSSENGAATSTKSSSLSNSNGKSEANGNTSVYDSNQQQRAHVVVATTASPSDARAAELLNDVTKMKEVLANLGKTTGSLSNDMMKIKNVIVDVLDRVENLESSRVTSSTGGGGSGSGKRADHWQELAPQTAWQFGSPGTINGSGSGKKRLRRSADMMR